jgi:hypothetical protein
MVIAKRADSGSSNRGRGDSAVPCNPGSRRSTGASMAAWPGKPVSWEQWWWVIFDDQVFVVVVFVGRRYQTDRELSGEHVSALCAP